MSEKQRASLPIQEAYIKAQRTGRVCSRCGWIVPIKQWLKGQRLCNGCLDALQGVNVRYGHAQPQQEIEDKTGEML